MGKWITGEDVARRLQLKRFEIFDHLASGQLQPYSSITGKKTKWLDFPRNDPSDSFNKWEYFKGSLFLLTDIEDFEERHYPQPDKKTEPAAVAEHHPQAATEKNAANFLTQESGVWHIGFEGQRESVRHVKGFLYIARLLEKPGQPISCIDLYQAASGVVPDKVFTEGMAMAEGLNTGNWSRQELSDPKAMQDYRQQRKELQEAIANADDTPQGKLIKKQSEEKLAKIDSHVLQMHRQRGVFTDTEKKRKQDWVRKGLDRAYKNIGKEGLKKMEKHLRDKIKAAGAYRYCYNGDLTWEITVK